MLSLRAPGRTHHLVLAVGPGRARFCSVERPPPNPKQPHAFQGYLRAHLAGRVAELGLVGGDRILRIVFERADGRAELLHEFTDRHGNVVVLTEGRIRASLSPLRPGLAIGEPWTPPGGAPRALPDRFDGFAGEARDRAVAAFFAQADADEAARARRAGLRRPLVAARKRLRRLRRQQEGDRARAKDAGRLRREGELLQASFHLLAKGQSSVELTDWYAEGTPTIAVELDPKLAPGEQIEARFKAARRAERAGQEAERRLATTAELQDEVDALLEAIDDADHDELAELTGLMPDWLPSPQAPANRRRAGPRLPYRAWTAPSGHEIRVGRRAADNDELTLHHSRGNDVWMHVKGSPGAHVVIRSPGEAPPLDLLLLGAQLAMTHSRIADGDRREVSWTRCKHVRKPKGFPPGRVRVEQEKVLFVEADRGALEALTPVDSTS